MKKLKSTFVVKAFLFSLLALTPGFKVLAQNEDELSRKIAVLANTNSELEMFSGTLLVARNGKVVYSGAFGEANKDNHVPNTLETRYNIGSIGKTITAVAIMQLVQEGKLKLSETLGKYYPECPFPEKETITIQHLLTHSSGLGDYMEHTDYKAKLATWRPIADALPLIFDQKPDFPAGEQTLQHDGERHFSGG
jgi:CubicO group peptidase (beta-lactamase class C family)